MLNSSYELVYSVSTKGEFLHKKRVFSNVLDDWVLPVLEYVDDVGGLDLGFHLTFLLLGSTHHLQLFQQGSTLGQLVLLINAHSRIIAELNIIMRNRAFCEPELDDEW